MINTKPKGKAILTQEQFKNLTTPVGNREYHIIVKEGGTTAERPTQPDLHQLYYDTTLNKLLVWNGSSWVDSDSNKLDKVTSGGVRRAYGVNNTNTQEMFIISASPLEFTIPFRDADGNFEVGNAVANTHVLNRRTADNRYVNFTSSQEIAGNKIFVNALTVRNTNDVPYMRFERLGTNARTDRLATGSDGKLVMYDDAWGDLRIIATESWVETRLATKLNSSAKGETANKTLTFGGTFKVLETLANGTVNERTMTLPSNPNVNNYLTGVSGNGNGTVTFTRQGLGNLTWSATHSHTIGDITGLQSALDGKLNVGANLPEAYLTWGGRNLVGNYGPIDAAMVSELGANRLAFIPVPAVTIEYSRDGGSTWVDYDASQAQKIDVFNGVGTNLVIGKNSSTGVNTSNYRLRVTINTSQGNLYTVLNKFVILMSANGSTDNWVTIDARLQSNFIANIDNWTVFSNQTTISGWSGYNIINTSGITTYGNTSSTQYGQVRFTFGCTGHDSLGYSGLQIQKILGFGGVGWNTPSTMAKFGRMYTYDYLQNAYFPNDVYANNDKKLAKEEDALMKSVGGKIDEKIQVNYTGALTYNNVGVEIREREQVGNTQSSNDYAPAIGFHWGARHGNLLLMDSNGVLKYGSNPGSVEALILNNDSRLTDSRPASDVYSWAKASAKPSYNLGEVSETTTYKRVTQTEKNTWDNKFNTPSGTTSQYVRGDGSIHTFPTIPGSVYKGSLGTIDLNTLNNEASQGIYYQSANVNATLARNYPTASAGAGVLKVYWSAANDGVVQEYNNYQDGRLYVRGYQGSTWSGWSTMQNEITGAATTITSNNLTTNRAVISNGSGKIAVSSVTSTELGYLSGVTSAVQTQLNGKEPTISAGTSAQYWRGDKTWQTLPTAPATNLGATHGTTSVTITSSTGSNTTINGATSSLAGVVTTGAQTFAGTKTFSSDPVVPSKTSLTASSSTLVATESQVFNKVKYGTNGGTKTGKAIEADYNTSTGILTLNFV